jgi:hypothetical protein
MRIITRVDGEWHATAAPTALTALLGWLRRLDGEQAVVADDANGIYYCAVPELIDLYEKKGKSAKMFSVLYRQIFERREIELGAQDLNN